MKNTIDNWRKNIDTLDKELLLVLSKRMEIVKKIGELKKTHGIPALDEKRWQEVIHSNLNLAESLHIPQDLVKQIFEIIHNFALKIEKESE